VISERSWDATLLACGAVIEACDKVMSGEFRNAFCATRPPGHHAGIFGKTFHGDDSTKACSNGFCFVNNVAVAAAYLKSQYRDKIKKIAIVDFDVHHGNGTQEIVEALIKPKEFIIKSNVSPFATCEIKSYQYKPWLDLDDGKNVLFTSIHLHGNTGGIFFPGTGSEDENTTDDDQVFPGGILNVPLTPGFATAQEWREAFTTKIFPRLMEF
jgi:acetoin utilization deacetylase AcuC-like enzyme